MCIAISHFEWNIPKQNKTKEEKQKNEMKWNAVHFEAFNFYKYELKISFISFFFLFSLHEMKIKSCNSHNSMFSEHKKIYDTFICAIQTVWDELNIM